ncbi:hypothetical protein SCUCBS95973_009422 [Sporothrix curviconia]|uniref:Xylanolytic transcriptional activator regulatory domain-containing protein n=1 Tax=Sporothrix curviconia TaxID=1260050 RepID=A0ABP0CUT7_9PEZI
METAEDLLMKALGRPSLQRLQALLLVILHRLESRDFSKAFMLVAFAARAAFALRLNYEPSHMTFEQQEIRRRVMWSTWATEKLWAGGLREFSLCPDDVINIRLPCPEEALETGESVDMDYLQVSLPVTPDLPGGADCNDDAGNGRDSGLLAQCFRLFSMRGRTMSEHAQSIIDTLCAVLDLPMELPLMDPDLATCVFQSARILHYVHLKTPNTSQKESWKLYNMLQSCVEVVKKIFGNTPVTAPVISDLQDLVTHGEFRGARERVDNLAEMPPSDPMWRAKSQQLLERHSLVRRANFINDSPDADTATAFNCEATDTSMLTPSSTTARAPCYETANLVGRFWGQLDTSEPAVATSAATAAAGLQQLGSDYARQDAAASLAVGLQMQQYQWDGVCPTPFQDLELLLSSEMHAGGWWPSQDQWNHA